MDGNAEHHDEVPKTDWSLLQRGMRQIDDRMHEEVPAVDITRPPVRFARALRHSDSRDTKSLRARLLGWWRSSPPTP